MRPAVSGALNKGEMSLVGHMTGKGPDRFGQTMGVVRDLDPLGNLRLGQSAGVKSWLFFLDLLPFEALVAAVGVEALAILPGGVEQAARHLGAHLRVANLECRGFN